jgi:protoporphyrinogen oxidase
VLSVEPKAGMLMVETEDDSEPFDNVIVTAAAPIASKLCPPLNATEKKSLGEIRYQGIVCASLVLSQPLPRYYVTNITESWVPFTAVINMSALVDTAEFGGKHLIYLPKYVKPDDPLFEATDPEIRRSFVDALVKMYPNISSDHIEAFRVSRVRNVLAISTLNYSRGVHPMTTSVPGLFLVNSSQITNGTLNVNETLLLADRAMKQVLAGAQR